MKKRIVKVLGFFVLNILFFTILLGFVSQSESSRTTNAPVPVEKMQSTENTADNSFKNTNQKLIVSTVVAELAIN